jgi:hypothetical protein
MPLPQVDRDESGSGVALNSAGRRARIMTESAAHVRIIEQTPAYWTVVFDNPPLNVMGASIFEGLQELLARMDASPSLRVVVFEKPSCRRIRERES